MLCANMRKGLPAGLGLLALEGPKMLRTEGGVLGVFGVRGVRCVLDVDDAEEGRDTVVVRLGTVEDAFPGFAIFDVGLREGDDGFGTGLGDLRFIGGVEGRVLRVTLTLSALR